MALSGIGSHSHTHGAHGHGHAHAHGHAHSLLSGGRGGGARGGRTHGSARTLWTLTSPRFLFSFALGVGATGLLLRPVLEGPVLLGAALVGGALFERYVVSPLWNFTMRFASTPASTLESAIASEATAVTSFDEKGQGIVSVEVDGQIVQILATLRAADRQFGGARIRAGQRLHIESVDADRHCCTVSL
jgi:hypothetical protein